MSKPKSNLTAERLREVLHYDPETGLFYRKIDDRRWKAGSQCGSIHKSIGYVYITIDGFSNTGHRFAWLHFHGAWPEGDIDHIDGNRSNNRISNLRDVSHQTNMQNRKTAQKDNSTGFLGVSPRRGGYRATIKVGKKQIYLGHFQTPEEAHHAFLVAKRLHHDGCTI